MRDYSVRKGLMQLAKKVTYQLNMALFEKKVQKVKMPVVNQTSVTTIGEMTKRKNILTSGCILETFFRRGKYLDMDFQTRLQLQKAVQQNKSAFIRDTFDYYMNGTKMKEHRIPSGWSDSTRSIFMLGTCRKD